MWNLGDFGVMLGTFPDDMNRGIQNAGPTVWDMRVIRAGGAFR